MQVKDRIAYAFTFRDFLGILIFWKSKQLLPFIHCELVTLSMQANSQYVNLSPYINYGAAISEVTSIVDHPYD